MSQVSDRLASLSPSATLAMSQKSGELKAQGVDVINLSVGEPDFNTPDHIKEAAKKAIDENYSRYSPVAGYPALRNAIVEKLKKENGLEYTAQNIDDLLARRHENKKRLRAGKHPKGPAKRRREQDEAFAKALEAVL